MATLGKCILKGKRCIQKTWVELCYCYCNYFFSDGCVPGEVVNNQCHLKVVESGRLLKAEHPGWDEVLVGTMWRTSLLWKHGSHQLSCHPVQCESSGTTESVRSTAWCLTHVTGRMSEEMNGQMGGAGLHAHFGVCSPGTRHAVDFDWIHEGTLLLRALPQQCVNQFLNKSP